MKESLVLKRIDDKIDEAVKAAQDPRADSMTRYGRQMFANGLRLARDMIATDDDLAFPALTPREMARRARRE